MGSIMHSVLLSGGGLDNNGDVEPPPISPTYDLPTHRKHKASTDGELNY
jgi:hypothetical protein